MSSTHLDGELRDHVEEHERCGEANAAEDAVDNRDLVGTQRDGGHLRIFFVSFDSSSRGNVVLTPMSPAKNAPYPKRRTAFASLNR